MSEKSLLVSLEAIDQRTGQYTLSFDSSQYPVRLQPEASITFSEWLRRLRPVLIGGRDPAADIDPQEDLLQSVGTWLWKALLSESAPAQEREGLAQALRTGHTPLLLDLPDALTGLPWELLYDPEQPDETGFLAVHRPLVRLSPKAAQSVPMELPLRVLLLLSSPPALGEDSRVDVESERAAVEQAIYAMREAGFLHLVVEDIVTPKRVERHLDRFKPHIVHYVGHGEYDQTNGGTLFWEDDQGNVLPLSASRLATLLRSRNLHAVILHGCETAKGNAEVQSLAGSLVQEGLPAVLAMQANFTYESSQLASRAWYQALVAGESMASTLLAARQALIKAGRPDWAVPILQASIASLTPLLDATPLRGSPDPLLTRVGAAADLAPPTDVFVGRHRELRALHLMLEDTSDHGPVLALITGPGGMGKSTLVAQAVSRYGGAYQAALMLRCQGYQSIDLFLQSIGAFLKRLGVPLFLEHTLPDPKRNLEAKIDEAVVALNRTGPVLLVIDNLESTQDEDQLISDKGLVYLLQQLLTNLCGGRVLVTGRSMMKDLVLQENVGTKFLHLDLEDLSPYETSQLLLRYPLLAKLSHVVRQILLREFGGLPYVYHLLSSQAAAQDLEQIIYEVRDYGVAKQKVITEELKQRAAEKWQKIHTEVVEFAALEVIISRLSEGSRTLLAQLSVLQQPFPLAAVEDGLGAVQAAWQPLLDWSLLHYDSHEKSYRLHSLTRRYVEGLLEEQSRKQAQTQLAAWYEHYADHDSHSLTDYLEAHRLLRAAGRKEQAGRLVLGIAKTLRRFGLYPLLRDLYAQTLSDIREIDELLVANTLEELGKIAHLEGKDKEARHFFQQCLDTAERWGLQSAKAATLHHLGLVALSQGEYEKARVLYQQSLAIEDLVGDQEGRASSLHELGNLALHQGEYEKARVLYQQSLAIKEDQEGQASSLFQLGVIAESQGEYEQARSYYQQSLDIAKRWKDQHMQAMTLHELGNLAQRQGKYEEARRLYQQSLAIKELLGNQKDRAGTLHALGMIARRQGEYEEAQSLYLQNLSIFERLGDQSGQANSLGELGLLAYEQGDFKSALTYTIKAYILFDALRSPACSFAQQTITRIRSHMDEETFIAHWRMFAGDRPLVATVEQKETQGSGKDGALTVKQLPSVVSFIILRGTTQKRLQFVATLIQAQQQLPPEAVPLGRFLGCLVAALRGETPETALLEPPFTQLWQEFQQRLRVPHEESSQQEKGKDG
jgi:tetratricopeptide (TPR) repeat protein